MELFLEILKFTIPSLILFFTVFIFLRTWSKHEEKRRKHEFNMHLQDEVLPIRLQAYERIILFMERIAPESVLLRLNRTGMSAEQLQKEVQITIKQEYEHNLTQQTYISTEAWQKVQIAKGQILKLVSDAMSELKPGASGATLGKLVLEKVMELKTTPSQQAIDFLKQEVRELFLH